MHELAARGFDAHGFDVSGFVIRQTQEADLSMAERVHEPGWWREALAETGLQVRKVSTFVAVPLLWRVHSALARWTPLGPRAGPGILLIADAPR